MFIVETYTAAVLLCILTMLAWGSWPNTQKLASKSWRFELFYWDFVFGIVLIGVLGALTLGSAGERGRGFTEDLTQADTGNMLLAALGGAVFNVANLLFVAAIAIAGISVAFPVGAGVGLVLGVGLNYLFRPDSDKLLLFPGVFLIVLAILLSATAYRKMAVNARQISLKGLLLATAAGILFGFFYRFVAASMITTFVAPEPGLLGPYTAVVCFAAGIFSCNLVLNPILMRKPVQGEPVSFRDYLKGLPRDHFLGVCGGAIWGTGLLCSILSSEKAGFAISFGLSQGNALVAALWGVCVWKEFKGGGAAVSRLLFGMFACYVLGLTAIILSKAY